MANVKPKLVELDHGGDSFALPITPGIVALRPREREPVQDPEFPRLGEIELKHLPISVAGVALQWQGLLESGDGETVEDVKNLLMVVRSLRRVVEHSRSNGTTIAESAAELGGKSGEQVERAVAGALDEHAEIEEKARQLQLFFRNLGSRGLKKFKNRIELRIVAKGELDTEAGQAKLDYALAERRDRPDPSYAYSFVAVPSSLGAKTLDAVSRICHDYLAVLFTDVPDYRTLEEMEIAVSTTSGLMRLAGRQTHQRHTVLYGNYLLARRRFVGRKYAENEDVYVAPSLVHLGQLLAEVASGALWKVPAGAGTPLVGVQGVRVDLLTKAALGEGHGVLTQARVNPAVLETYGGSEAVLYDCAAASTEADRPQIGTVLVERELADVSDRILKKEALFKELSEAQPVVESICNQYILDNSGSDGFFAPGSEATVIADREEKLLSIIWDVEFRELIDGGEVTIRRKEKGKTEIVRS